MRRDADWARSRLAAMIGQWDGTPFAEFDNGKENSRPLVPNLCLGTHYREALLRSLGVGTPPSAEAELRYIAFQSGAWERESFPNPPATAVLRQSPMPLYYNVRRKNTNPSGKFYRMAGTGLARGESADYRGWAYELVRHTTGTTVRRTVYHVTVTDPTGFRAAYLTNFQAAGKAVAAARERIDQAIANTIALNDCAQ